MKIVYSAQHAAHHGRAELNEGRLVPCFERPERAERVLHAIDAAGLGPVIAPDRFARADLERVHPPAYLDFLAGAHRRWHAAGREGDALPMAWPVPGLRKVLPQDLDGQLGYYAFSADAPIGPGTWEAVEASAFCALSGAALIAAGDRVAFSLCRPPGHHAHSALYGGYCYLNNAALAAEALRAHGADRVAVLDIDYHHGNGTQDIFYARGDVLFASLHADPDLEFPYYLGRADEVGLGPGIGANHNFPLPWGTDFGRWSAALDVALRRIAAFAPDALVVSLGVDIYRDDPISRFAIDSADFLTIGRRLGGVGVPILLVMEGGYATEAIGDNVVNVLRGVDG